MKSTSTKELPIGHHYRKADENQQQQQQQRHIDGFSNPPINT
jgi:hypothetical protein